MLLEEMQSLGEDSIDRAKVGLLGNVHQVHQDSIKICSFTMPIVGEAAVC